MTTIIGLFVVALASLPFFLVGWFTIERSVDLEEVRAAQRALRRKILDGLPQCPGLSPSRPLWTTVKPLDALTVNLRAK